jgi:hypothetical protein
MNRQSFKFRSLGVLIVLAVAAVFFSRNEHLVGRDLWLLNPKNLAVSMNLAEGFWVWEKDVLYITRQ